MPRIEFPVALDRKFQLWSFDVSHSVLLLRSVGDGASTRIDVMFRAVREMRVRKVVEGLALDIVRDGDPRLVEFGVAPDPYRHVFAVSSPGFPYGYVIAASVFTAEDDLSYGDPSALDHSELEGHVIRSTYFES